MSAYLVTRLQNRRETLIQNLSNQEKTQKERQNKIRKNWLEFLSNLIH